VCRGDPPLTPLLPAHEQSEHKDDARLRDKRVARGLSGGDPRNPPCGRRASGASTKAMPVCGISGSREGCRGETLRTPPAAGEVALGCSLGLALARVGARSGLRSVALGCSLGLALARVGARLHWVACSGRRSLGFALGCIGLLARVGARSGWRDVQLPGDDLREPVRSVRQVRLLH
jgi:hypothetical protein